MSTKLYFEEDSIQLIELNSEHSSVQSPLKKLKKKNKIDSPTVLSTNSVSSSPNSKISNVFIVKQLDNSPKPIPQPRKIHTKQISSQSTPENIVKSSETPDTVSGDVLSIFSQKSESLSYKERLRNRFLTIKKQAESSVQSKELKNKFKATGDTDTEEQLSLHLNKREKHKTELSIVEDCYNFFFKEQKNEPKQEETEEEISEENKQSVSDFLGLVDTDVVEYVFPYVVDYSLGENTIFKVIKKRYKVRDELKIQQINYEEDGIYKENVHNISKYQLKIIEDKLFDDERSWFQIDGQLKLLPDPRLQNSYKPIETDIKHSDFILKYVPPTLYEPAENIIQDNTLQIILHEIKFNHHHLFTKEHVLQQKLIEFYNEYNKLTSENVFVILIKKLETLRFAKNRLQENISSSGDCNQTELEKYQKYLSEISELKEKIYKLGSKERNLKKSILFLWKCIKKLRNNQQHQLTNIKLIITKETVDYNNEKQQWDNNIELETSECLEKLENDFQIELNLYKTKLKQWKNDQTRENDSEISSENLEKPRKPKRKFNQEQIKTEIENKFCESFKPPGEPNLEFSLQFVDISAENRFSELSKVKIFVKILQNNKEICKTKSVVLDEKFICSFEEEISVKLKFSRSLTLEICEQVGQISKRIISEICVEIPELSNSISEAEKQTEKFDNSEKVTCGNSGIGTGVELNKIVNFSDVNLENFVENNKLYLSGELSFSLGWNLDKNMEQIIVKTDENYKIPSIYDLENLEELIKNFPDPLDPKNVLFFDYINKYHKFNYDKNYFHLNPHMDLEFCDYNNLESNPRFKLLRLRFSDEPEFKNMVIPNRIKEIDLNIFSMYEKRRKDEIITQEMLLEQETIDSQRIWTRKYLEQAEQRIVKLTRLAEKKICLKDVLFEEFTPSFKSLGANFLNWLQPKRPLRPTRKMIRNTTAHVSLKDLNILVNIIGAIQVPNRKEMFSNDSMSSTNKDLVRPFVVVSFKDINSRTTVAEGSNPIWNQELSFCVSNNEHFTLKSLYSIQENIIISLYDETIDDLLEDDRFRDRNIHQIIGCNWLGNFEIPFKALLLNNRIEGTFKLNLPTLLLGYERQNLQTFSSSSEITQKIDTFITVFITLQPVVQLPDFEIHNDLECIETQYMEQYINNWQQEYNNNFPNRKFCCLVTSLSGERCCMTRLFKEIKLPELFFDDDNIQLAEIQLARFVSLINFRECGQFTDIWLNSEQILSFMMGSIKDHCVLLTNYFITIGLKCWFVLGHSLVEGFCSYVLIEEKTVLTFDYFIYDVKTCKKYNVYDSNSPLSKVFCAVNNENIWANVQPDDRITQTRFDFTKSGDWLPLFNNNVSAPTNIQHLNIQYFEPSSLVSLQEKIEIKLRKKFMKWRKFTRTMFSHYCNSVFKKILVKLEQKSMQEVNFSETPEHFPEIQTLMASYQVKGFVKNFSYTNLNDLVQFLHKTGLHLNDNPNIEFSISVFMNSYCNNTVIIWLFVASLLRKR